MATYRKLILILHSHGRVNTAYKIIELIKSNKDTQGDSQHYVVDVFKEYLHDCYSECPHPSSRQWPFCLHTTYTELELLTYDTQTEDNTDKVVPLNSPFGKGKSKAKRKVILLEGVAGAGKSTLSWYACKEWAAGRIFDDINLLIFVSLSDPDVHSARELADLIPDPRKEIRTSVAAAIAENRGEGVCFWLEGCDEAPPSLWDSFLSRFIAGTGGRSMVSKANLVLTSRPYISAELDKCLTRKVVIKGFKSLDAYLNSAFLGNSQSKLKLLEALQSKPELVSLCHLPLNAVILVYIHDILRGNLPTTRTGLFDPLIRNYLIRHIQTRTKHEIQSIDNYDDDLPMDVHSSLQKVSQLAYEAILQHRKILDKKMLRSHGITDTDHALGLLRRQLAFTLYGPKHFYAFIHLSLQEYLAAYHISQMTEIDQIKAFGRIYEQNPLSPVLTFYAGLTKLSNDIIRTKLCLVLKEQCDIRSFTKIIFNYKPSSDIRKQLLALMNCVYESQRLDLFRSIELEEREPPEPALVDKPVFQITNPDNSDDLPPKKYASFFLTRLDLYPTDCLSIAYFVRQTSSLGSNEIHLILTLCKLSYMELKALIQELSKPAHKQNVILNLSLVFISKKSLRLFKTLFNPQSCLAGLIVSDPYIEDNNLAVKQIIEGLYLSSAKESTIQLAPSRFTLSNIYHLILMVRCDSLRSLKLSSPLFGHDRFMLIFCEALKCSRVVDLSLDDSNINDSSLRLLASAVCDKRTTIMILSLYRNPYTQEGLTQFFQFLLTDIRTVELIELTVNQISGFDQLLIERFSNERNKLMRGYPRLNVKCYSTDEILTHLGSYHALNWEPISDFSARTLHHF